MHCEYFDTTWKGNHSSFLTPTVAGGRCPFCLKFTLKVTHPLRKTQTSTKDYCAGACVACSLCHSWATYYIFAVVNWTLGPFQWSVTGTYKLSLLLYRCLYTFALEYLTQVLLSTVSDDHKPFSSIVTVVSSGSSNVSLPLEHFLCSFKIPRQF